MAKNVAKGAQNAQVRGEIGIREIVPCVIKRAARKAMKGSENKQQILTKFREYSIKCTKIARLASLLIHFVFNKKMDTNDAKTINDFFNVTDDFRPKNSPTEQVLKDYFYSVTVNYTHSPEYPMDKYAPEFRDMMQQFEVESPDNEYMENIFKHMYQQYRVNFKNNIVVHAKKRITKFLMQEMYRLNPVPPDIDAAAKKVHRKENNTAVYKTTCFLFDGTVEFNGPLLNEFETILQPNSDNVCGLFYDIEQDWFKLLPLFFRLQRHIFAQQQSGHNIRNFVIVPQTSFQRRHIHIDTSSLYRIFTRLDLIQMKTKTKKIPMSDYTKTSKQCWKLWSEIFDEKEVNTRDKKFDNSISTDGLAMSICCQKSVLKKSDEEKRKECKQKLDNGDFDDLAGGDPGKRLVLGGVVRNISTGKERNIRVKNGKFYRYSREHRRNRAKKRIDNILQAAMAEDAKIYGIVPSNMR